MKWLIALAALAAACDSTPCEDATLLAACPECGPGEVRAGVTTGQAGGGGAAAARPGGGVARIGCDSHLVRHAADFSVDGDVGLFVQGDAAVEGVTADDLVLVLDRVSEGLADLVAVAESGTEVWRIPAVAGAAGMTAAGETVVAFGRSDDPQTFGDFTVQGMWAVAVGAADGQARWAWSSPQGPEATIVAAGAADGSVVVAGRFDGGLELGGTTPPLSTDGASGFVGLIDASGAGVWARQLIGPARDEVVAVARGDDGSTAIAGSYQDGTLDLDAVVLRPEAETADQFVAVLEADGTPRWGTNLGDAALEPIAAMAVAGGSVVVGGQYSDLLSFGGDAVAVEGDAFIASLTGGVVNWVVQIGGAGAQAVTALGWNGALQVSVAQVGQSGQASLDFRDTTLEGDGALHLELAP